MRYFFCCCLFQCCLLLCSAQVRLVILGSSTAAGTGASVYDSSWAGRLQKVYRKNLSAGNPDTVVTNLAVPGTTTYSAMPSNYTPPAGRPLPDPAHNVTKALSLTPDVVIISFPTNDIGAGYSTQEYLDNLRYLYHYVRNAGPNVFIATSQPRSTYAYESRKLLWELVDSINQNFSANALDFWDDLATTDGQYDLRPEVNSGDGTHPNDLGHRLLFQRVMARNIFVTSALLSLSGLELKGVAQGSGIALHWHVAHVESGSAFEIQRQDASGSFQTLGTEASTPVQDYDWTDSHPLQGKNLYRLKVLQPLDTRYSAILEIEFPPRPSMIGLVYTTGATLHAEIQTARNGDFALGICDASGAVVRRESRFVAAPATRVSLSLGTLPAGIYFLQVSGLGQTGSRPFVKRP
ncbi:MAG: SGNH/GDSL hydrolase family protein [Flavisolibacter sp.]